jgi:proline iminopeptidase
MIRFAARVTLISLGFVGATNTLVAASPTANTSKLASGEHAATLDDVRLHYTVAGKGPLLIVCSPGWGINSGYLQGGLVPLEKTHTLLFIDTRGSGLSSRPVDRSKMSSANMADDIEHLRQYLGLPSIQLVGHSDSADIAIDYAERYPALVDKLILVDGITLGDGKANKEEDDKRDQLMKDLSSDPRYASAIRALETSNGTTDKAMSQRLKDVIAVYFANPEKNTPLFAKTMGASASPSSWAARTHAEANKARAWRQEEQLGEIRSRTLIIVGKQDVICPALISEHVHDGIRGSKLVEIEGSGHFPWAEQPALFFEALDQFLVQN